MQHMPCPRVRGPRPASWRHPKTSVPPETHATSMDCHDHDGAPSPERRRAQTPPRKCGHLGGLALALQTAALAQHAAWYGGRCIGLDVVVALDGPHGVLTPPTQAPEMGPLALQGWRSVSVSCPPYGMVLYAPSGAPDFLRSVTGRAFRQGNNSETLFARGKN